MNIANDLAAARRLGVTDTELLAWLEWKAAKAAWVNSRFTLPEPPPFGKQREARVQLSDAWNEFRAAQEREIEAMQPIWAAERGSDDRGYHGGFLSSND